MVLQLAVRTLHSQSARQTEGDDHEHVTSVALVLRPSRRKN